MTAALRNLASFNGRFAPAFAQTMLASPRATAEAAAFDAWSKDKGFEFTDLWADNNFPFVTPVLRKFAQWRESVDYLEIGAYEGRNLAFMAWLLPEKLNVTVIDPWFDEALNPEEKYHQVEQRFLRNAEKFGFPRMRIQKDVSTYELPRMLERGEGYDLIYVDGVHTSLGVMIDLCYCASLLRTGGLMVLDDYWHHESEIGGPGVKQAVDRFHATFKDYFELEAVYRQVILKKTAHIPLGG
jgi:hypothetical protein